MQLNLHRKDLTLFVSIGETDGFRKINLFEDLDETFLNYNINSTTKCIEYTCEDNLNEIYSILKKKKKKKSFIDNFYNKKND